MARTKMKKNNTKHHQCGSLCRGFTVLEMSVYTLIVGIVLIGIMDIYSQYEKATYVKIVQSRIDTINQAIQNYVNNNIINPYHLLPCPADPSLAMGNPNFGVALAYPSIAAQGAPPAPYFRKFYDYPCPAPTASAFGGDGTIAAHGLQLGGGIKRLQASAARTAVLTAGSNFVNDVTPLPSAGWIRQGAVPVKDLGLGNDYIAEPSGNLFIYAVSEELANLPPQPSTLISPDPPIFQFSLGVTDVLIPATDTNPYAYSYPDVSRGAIDIQNMAGSSIINPQGAAQYIIISPGQGNVGGYTTQGVLHACTVGSAQVQENCSGTNGGALGGTYYKIPYGE